MSGEIYKLIETHDKHALEEMLRRGNPSLRIDGGDYTRLDTPLVCAVGTGDVDIVKLLVTGGADPNLMDDEGRLPLGVAIEGSHEEVAEILLEAGADPLLENDKGNYFLHFAAQNGHVELATRLIALGIPIDGGRHETALHVACTHGHDTMVTYLLDNGANIEARSSIGRTPLMQASSSAARLLILRGADVDARGNEGGEACNAVALATVDRGCRETLLLLLAAGATPDAPEGSFYAPLETRSRECAALLFAAGCKRRTERWDPAQLSDDIAAARVLIDHCQWSFLKALALELCIALAELPVLILIHVLDEAVPLASSMPFGLKWKFAARIKHWRPLESQKICVGRESRGGELAIDAQHD